MMKNQVTYTTRGHRADIGPFEIYRLVSNNFVSHVGHFVFLDYIPPFMLPEKRLNPDAAHPHRGIATLTYSLNGEVEHFDSRGHQGIIHSGGVQWMKAGNGIIHNEAAGPDSKTGGKLMHGFQFWINLPAKIKQEDPEYMALQAEQLPLVQLPDNSGSLKVVVGHYAGQSSAIPTYAYQYLYHIRLNPGSTFILPSEDGLEYAVFLPQHDLTINDSEYHLGTLVGFDDEGGEIAFTNHLDTEAEFILFGGEKYTEPFVAYGPFVMSKSSEIQQEQNNYMRGKNGKIKVIDKTFIPHSLGTFWGSITRICGFKSGTRHGGKVTGIAAYGNPNKLIEKKRKILCILAGAFSYVPINNPSTFSQWLQQLRTLVFVQTTFIAFNSRC